MKIRDQKFWGLRIRVSNKGLEILGYVNSHLWTLNLLRQNKELNWALIFFNNFLSQIFRLESEPIGKGEYGKVLSAEWPDQRRTVAVKEITLPIQRLIEGKNNLPGRLDEFSKTRHIKHLFNEKSSHHQIHEHYGNGRHSLYRVQ